MATADASTTDVEVENKTNNNNDADDGALDSTKLKDTTQEVSSEVDVKMEQSSQGNNNNNNEIASDLGEKIREQNDNDNEDDDDEDDNDNDEDNDNDNDDDNGDAEGANDESMEDDGEKTNLIVNYLPQEMTDEQFKELFTKFGEMKSCKIVRNRLTGCSYGFGFVDFETHEQAIKAIGELNGQEVETKKIKVAFARPAGQDIKQANLYVKNIPLSWTGDDVRKAFEAFGNIIQVRVLGGERGVGFVLYDLRKQAEMALESMQGKIMDGCDQPLEIKFAADKKSDSKRSNRRGRGSSGGGRTRERANRSAGGGGAAGGANNRNNRNRSQSNSRPRSQPRGNRSQSAQRGNRGQNSSNINSNSNNNNGNNFNGFGPIRQQQNNRVHRYAPFAPVQQQQQQVPFQQQQAAATQMAAYGYASHQQYMHPYMMQHQQAYMNPVAATQPMAHAVAPMQAYQIPPQMAPISYGAAPQAAQSQAATAQTMSNMYNMASSTMQNAAQMQPQLGQPMNQVRGSGGIGGGNQSSGAANDGVTLFVYNIGPNSDETELRTMFAPYGQVLRCNVVRKTPGGETKGFGFVTLKDKSQANSAIASLHGSPRNGKTLQVSFKK